MSFLVCVCHMFAVRYSFYSNCLVSSENIESKEMLLLTKELFQFRSLFAVMVVVVVVNLFFLAVP